MADREDLSRSKTTKKSAEEDESPLRAQYARPKKAFVSILYPYCRTPKDKDRLAAMAFIDTRQKLYNLASRISATRPHVGSSQEISSDDGYHAVNDLSRLFLRDDPKTVVWSEDDDRYIRDHFGNTFIEEIGVFLDRSETAVAYRARELGLRNVPKCYDFCKVAPWLGLALSDLYLLSKHGLEIFPCTDSRGRVRIVLVSTTSLARVLIRGRLWKRLLNKERYDADEFFIKDIFESIVALQRGETIWEPNIWVSHGHTCLNPFSELSFGQFYCGVDKPMSEARIDSLDPRDLAPSADVASDNWLRGTHGRDHSDQDLKEISDEMRRSSFDLAEV